MGFRNRQLDALLVKFPYQKCTDLKGNKKMEVKNPQECENMQDIRLAIDQLDKIIVETIARRAQYVHAAAKFKKNEADVKDENRVKKVIDSKMTLARENNVSPKLIGQIYEMMINHFINEEMSEWKSQ